MPGASLLATLTPAQNWKYKEVTSTRATLTNGARELLGKYPPFLKEMTLSYLLQFHKEGPVESQTIFHIRIWLNHDPLDQPVLSLPLPDSRSNEALELLSKVNHPHTILLRRLSILGESKLKSL